MSQIPPNLNKWIQHKLDNYKEKPRKGTPKGESYGIPKQKYHAALLHLAYTRTFNLREIANQAGVSYSLLANWRTEDRFKFLVGQAAWEYATTILKLIVFEDYNLDFCKTFARQEVPGYSLRLVNMIIENLTLMLMVDTGEAKSLPWLPQFKKLEFPTGMKIIALFLSIFGTMADVRGDRDMKVTFLESADKISSLLLDLIRRQFRLAMNKGPKKFAQELFDEVLEEELKARKELLSLRKELVRKGLDARLTGAK
jgi:hypothetical protein